MCALPAFSSAEGECEAWDSHGPATRRGIPDFLGSLATGGQGELTQLDICSMSEK